MVRKITRIGFCVDLLDVCVTIAICIKILKSIKIAKLFGVFIHYAIRIPWPCTFLDEMAAKTSFVNLCTLQFRIGESEFIVVVLLGVNIGKCTQYKP
ncbi:MAG: hypothetical protein BWX90_00417 [bacterium ADurb.Bin132]|nr:MAG: hypothetical protein BWX90_00417 [bacterium ADurb.Bin132]